jgi:hypothetical protein
MGRLLLVPRSESDWVFEVEEISANVYRVTGRDVLGRSVVRTGTDPDLLLAECKRDALEVSGANAEEG